MPLWNNRCCSSWKNFHRQKQVFNKTDGRGKKKSRWRSYSKKAEKRWLNKKGSRKAKGLEIATAAKNYGIKNKRIKKSRWIKKEERKVWARFKKESIIIPTEKEVTIQKIRVIKNVWKEKITINIWQETSVIIKSSQINSGEKGTIKKRSRTERTTAQIKVKKEHQNQVKS